MRTLAVATALPLTLTASPASASTTPSLPRPTGHEPVGVTALSLKDTSRPDPWVPTVPYRELMVSVFYPAASAHGPAKQYMTPLESERNLGRENIPGLPPDVPSTVRTNAVVVDDQPGFGEKLAQVRSKDTSFVLDSLEHSRWGTLIDPRRIGMTGHSAGGAITTQAMPADRRIRAGADYTPGQPGPYGDWETDWTHLTGWKRRLMVPGTVHSSFTDLGVLAAQLGVDIGACRALAVTRNHVGAFFDQNLRCRPQPLLAAPSPAYPEVTFIG
ncbi:hypothetical protein GCM10027258_74000 [Amycolatopsis stemonae]